MDFVAPPSKRGRRNPSVTSSRFLVAKGDFPTTRPFIISLSLSQPKQWWFLLYADVVAKRNAADAIAFKGGTSDGTPYIGDANVFVSHAWKYDCVDVIGQCVRNPP